MADIPRVVSFPPAILNSDSLTRHLRELVLKTPMEIEGRARKAERPQNEGCD